MSTRTAGFPAAPKTPGTRPQPTSGIAHGLTVTLPGGHQCTVYTATDDDAETIRDMVRHNGCQAVLFDYPQTATGTYSR